MMPPAPPARSLPGQRRRARRAPGPRAGGAARASLATSARAADPPTGSWRVDDARPPPAVIGRDVESAVAPDEHVDRATPPPVARAPTRREVLDPPGLSGRQNESHDLVAGRRELGAGAVKGDEEVVAIHGRKPRAGIKSKPEWRRVRGQLERGERESAALVRAAEFTIGREHAPLRIAVRPAIVGALPHRGEEVGRGAAGPPVTLVDRRPRPGRGGAAAPRRP